MNRKTCPELREKGFTLIELLVVLVILGLLAGISGPQVLKYLKKAKTDTARLQIADLAGGVDLFNLEIGRNPSTEEGLLALVQEPDGVSGWNGPYLKKKVLPKDPWGINYQYQSPGKEGDYDIYTLGADNVQGGDHENQDVGNW
ncbi:MAG: type II secretion system major pseudopilin GspG [Motiliproteus sp.]